jgi:hypothetical protein
MNQEEKNKESRKGKMAHTSEFECASLLQSDEKAATGFKRA